MGVFLITYDLIKDKDYKKLFEKLESYGTYSHCLESVWMIESSDAAATIRKYIETAMDSDDKILVCRLSGNWSSNNLRKKTNEWLHNRTFNCSCE
ncbi:MAG: CRISPR-associated endoribonuclease Cas2 [Candidatus Izimaplasma bacterium HR2]|nr:MAG: CRISPR-associated endoribonuclease Cas2 [Candidatus Izimaplasma bacterium HR2]